MKIEPKAIYTNLKNWDFSTLGPYKINEEEAEAIKEIYEKGISQKEIDSAVMGIDFSLREVNR